MTKKYIRIALLIVVALLVNLSIPTTLIAEGYQSTLYGPQSVEKGAKITISFGISDARNITGFQAVVTYDPSVMTYDAGSLSGPSGFQKDEVAAGSEIRIGGFGADAHNVTNIASMTFTSIAAVESTSISIGSVKLAVLGGGAEAPAGASTSVTITPPRSGNADLSALSVDQGQLSPTFNPGTQNYSIQVGMGVERVVVSATPADPKATVNVSGNSGLKDGANPIRVVVTAENGSTKTYTITANRLGPTPTPEPTPTPPMSVAVDGKPFYVIDLPEGVEVPSGFYEAAIEINGQMVTAYKSRQGGLVLLYLSNEGPESGFYFYDAQTGEFYKFAQLTVPGATYTRIVPDESVVVPAGFVEARITIDGEAFDCWKPYSENGDVASESGIYLLYLLNDKGEKGFYLFQNSTRLIFPFSAVPREPEPTPLPSPTPLPTPTPAPVVETNYSQTSNPYFVVTIILASIIVLLSGVLTWLLIRRRSGRNDSGPFDDGGGFGGSDDNGEPNSETNFIRPPKIRRVGAPTVDDDFDE